MKRKKTTNQTSTKAISAPTIEGLPQHLSETLIQSMKQMGKFYKNQSKKEATSSTNPVGQCTTILHGQIEPTDKNSEKLEKEKLNTCISQLLTSIHACLDSRNTNNNDVDVSCLMFVMKLIIENQQEAQKPWIIQSAIRVLLELCLRSKACREILVSAPSSTTTKNPPNTTVRIKILMDSILIFKQDEILQQFSRVLINLKERFGHLYPQLHVAHNFYHQNCINEGSTSNNHDYSINRLRFGRDQALQYYNVEIEKIQKLINRADTCFEILVPRFGFGVYNEATMKAKKDISHEKQEEEESDNDDGIEWEDGDEEQESLQQELTHAERVERTLAAISVARTDYQVELNFQESEEEEKEEETNENSSEALAAAKANDNIERIVKRFSQRHIPRLKWWIDSLISADDMYAVPGDSNNNGSHIILPISSRRKRQDVLKLLVDVRVSMLSTIQSASKLGFQEQNNVNQAQNKANVIMRQRTLKKNDTREVESTAKDRLELKVNSQRKKMKPSLRI